jgi:hypothetical protein
MAELAFRINRKSPLVNCLAGLWGPCQGDMLYDMAIPGKGNHCSRVGGEPRWDLDTLRGYVPYFDGVNDSWDSERSLNIGWTAFTVCAWVWLDSTITHGAVALGQTDVGVRRWAFWVQNADNANAQLRFNGIAIVATAAAGSFLKDQWVHIAASRRRRPGAQRMDLYQNGALVASDAFANSNLTATEPLTIGSFDADPIYYWKGKITDARYYNRGLTMAEVNWIYRTTRWETYKDIRLRPFNRLILRHSNAK